METSSCWPSISTPRPSTASTRSIVHSLSMCSAPAARPARLSEAGRHLFAVSRTKKKSRNDADRLRKYLARFGMSWSDFTSRT